MAVEKKAIVVVNADDFGRSEEVNRAIVACFNEGLISSTTIMANMPGFQAACEIAENENLSGHIGIHLNLTEGMPLTDGIRSCPRFCNNEGEFSYKGQRPLWLAFQERAVLAAEIGAQIENCLVHGLSLTHADSHHHVHTEAPVFSVMKTVLGHHGIRRVRISRNTNMRRISLPKKIYKIGFNQWLTWHGFRRTDYFGDLDEFNRIKPTGKLVGKSFEIMVHPSYGEEGTLIDFMDGLPLMERLREALKDVVVEFHD
jgi:chitin disaccharide deacetylase